MKSITIEKYIFTRNNISDYKIMCKSMDHVLMRVAVNLDIVLEQ